MAYKVTDLRGRFKDAPWANSSEIITIGGVGGIGSWVAFFLARAGYKLVVYDFDTVEEVNLGGQLYSIPSIGKSKTRALIDIITDFCGPVKISAFNKFEEGSLVTPITVAAFDNMASRKVMFEEWKKLEDRAMFIDGRLLAETYTIQIVLPGAEEQYESTLFEDSEVPDGPCTFRSTTHCGASMGTQITGIINNMISNSIYGSEIRTIPKFISYSFPLMLTNDSTY
jgi:hypothetical protein